MKVLLSLNLFRLQVKRLCIFFRFPSTSPDHTSEVPLSPLDSKKIKRRDDRKHIPKNKVRPKYQVLPMSSRLVMKRQGPSFVFNPLSRSFIPDEDDKHRETSLKELSEWIVKVNIKTGGYRQFSSNLYARK